MEPNKKIQELMGLINSFKFLGKEEFIPKFYNSIEDLNHMVQDHPEEHALRKRIFDSCEGLDQSIMFHRARHKPLGYAGDYLLLDWIHTRKTRKNGMGKEWDLFFHEFSASQAVRNRKLIFSQLLKEISDSFVPPISILNLACGSGRDIFETFKSLEKTEKEIYFYGVKSLSMLDQEPKALKFSKKLFGKRKRGPHITWNLDNVLRTNMKQKFHLIWSAGLFDYLNDRLAIFSIKKMYSWLAKDGIMVFGNFHPQNPQRVLMELCGQWFLFHRTEEDLRHLVVCAGIPKENLEMSKEPLGINLFCKVRK